MKLGCCGGFQEKEMLKEIGFDFLEGAVAELIPLENEESFANKRKELADVNIAHYAFNCFIPGDLKVCGPEVEMDKLKAYVDVALARVKELGGEIVVFGSGGARSVPDGFSKDKAWEQIKDFLKMVADLAKIHGVTIVIEPLRSAECNILNTLAESVKMAKEIAREEIKVLVDLYHLVQENEPFDHIKEAGDLLTHVHVADTKRLYPGSGTYDYDTFFEMLKEINYQGGISIECGWQDKKKETEKAFSFLKGYLD